MGRPFRSDRPPTRDHPPDPPDRKRRDRICRTDHGYFPPTSCRLLSTRMDLGLGSHASWYRVTPESITAGDVIRIVNTWKEAVVNLDKMLYEDAKKEFSMTAQTGFGADGNQKQKKIDFEQVRGAFENNPFVETVQEHIKAKTALGDELIERLKNI